MYLLIPESLKSAVTWGRMVTNERAHKQQGTNFRTVKLSDQGKKGKKAAVNIFLIELRVCKHLLTTDRWKSSGRNQ